MMVEVMEAPTPALSKGSIILVTGGTGLIGLHVIDKLLERQYVVRVATRNVDKVTWMNDFYHQRHPDSLLELVKVADYGDSEALNEALQGVSGIVHMAANTNLNPNPNEVIPPSIEQNKTILTFADQHKSVTRVVCTSSSTAMHAPEPGVQFHVDDTTWNEDDVQKAWAPPPYEESRGYTVYSANKVATEKAIWSFMDAEKPSFVLNTILPDCAFGQSLYQASPSTTAGLLKSAFSGVEDGKSRLEDTAANFLPPQWMVDVEDIARVHVIALLDPDVQSKRLLCFAHKFNWTKVISVFKKLYPDRRFVEVPSDELEDLSTVDTGIVPDLLKKWYDQDGFTAFEDTIRKNIEE